jgi:predicted RecA/RadA family phage recombinase
MSETIRVFVNASAVDVPAGADGGQAVRGVFPALESPVASGTAYVTDGRGIEIDPSFRLESGAILRVGARARRGSATGNADA